MYFDVHRLYFILTRVLILQLVFLQFLNNKFMKTYTEYIQREKNIKIIKFYFREY